MSPMTANKSAKFLVGFVLTIHYVNSLWFSFHHAADMPLYHLESLCAGHVARENLGVSVNSVGPEPVKEVVEYVGRCLLALEDLVAWVCRCTPEASDLPV